MMDIIRCGLRNKASSSLIIQSLQYMKDLYATHFKDNRKGLFNRSIFLEKNNFGQTLLHLAVKTSEFEIVNQIYDWYAEAGLIGNKDFTDNILLNTAEDGTTLLHAAVTQGNKACILLITSLYEQLPDKTKFKKYLSNNNNGYNLLHMLGMNPKADAICGIVIINFIYFLENRDTLKAKLHTPDKDRHLPGNLDKNPDIKILFDCFRDKDFSEDTLFLGFKNELATKLRANDAESIRPIAQQVEAYKRTIGFNIKMQAYRERRQAPGDEKSLQDHGPARSSQEEERPRRSPLAQAIHTEILKNLNRNKPVDLKGLEQHKHLKAALLERSVNGNSHVQDIVHLGTELGTSTDTLISSLHYMTNLYAKHFSYADDNFIKVIFLNATKDGFTLMQQAVTNGSPAIILFITSLYEQLYAQGYDDAKIKACLATANSKGFNLLHNLGNNPKANTVSSIVVINLLYYLNKGKALEDMLNTRALGRYKPGTAHKNPIIAILFDCFRAKGFRGDTQFKGFGKDLATKIHNTKDLDSISVIAKPVEAYKRLIGFSGLADEKSEPRHGHRSDRNSRGTDRRHTERNRDSDSDRHDGSRRDDRRRSDRDRDRRRDRNERGQTDRRHEEHNRRRSDRPDDDRGHGHDDRRHAERNRDDRGRDDRRRPKRPRDEQGPNDNDND